MGWSFNRERFFLVMPRSFPNQRNSCEAGVKHPGPSGVIGPRAGDQSDFCRMGRPATLSLRRAGRPENGRDGGDWPVADQRRAT
jgi:hypothetical protein